MTEEITGHRDFIQLWKNKAGEMQLPIVYVHNNIEFGGLIFNSEYLSFINFDFDMFVIFIMYFKLNY